MQRLLRIVLWTLVSILGAAAYAVIALRRGEPLNAAWIVVAALCTYAIGIRFYSKWIAAKALVLDDLRAPPAEVHDDGRDFVRTNKLVLFGHHFASISGPGPLVGPVLAAQFGYLPGTLWILIGALLGGAVQDFVILFASVRRDGKSLAEMVREEVSGLAGTIAMVAILGILVILVASLGLVVDNALAESPWGIVTTAMTMPFAVIMGLFLRYVRVGKVMEMTAIGVVFLGISLLAGYAVNGHPTLAPIFTLSKEKLALCLIAYGFVASVLPVWLLLAPRDYLVTFLKIGVVILLAVGILLVLPPIRMPWFNSPSSFTGGMRPVVAGSLFPFCFITIACGAISGFHALVSSGTTPKMVTRERTIRHVGYGAMCLESFVAIMAMIAACVLDPGLYFAVNTPAALVGATPESVAHAISGWGFIVTPEQINALAASIGEGSVLARAGGAPTLAIGMASIFRAIIGGDAAMKLWYHFALMFEALFILTTVDVATRIGRFLIQELGGRMWKPAGDTKSYPANIGASLLPLLGRSRSAGWGEFALATLRHRQPIARVRGPVSGRDHPHQGRPSPVRVGSTASLGVPRHRDLHRGDREDLSPEPAYRIPGCGRQADCGPDVWKDSGCQGRGHEEPDLQQPPGCGGGRLVLVLGGRHSCGFRARMGAGAGPPEAGAAVRDRTGLAAKDGHRIGESPALVAAWSCGGSARGADS
jgi:carbon starvation protein